MTERIKNISILLLFGVLAVLVLLAGSLSNLKLQSGSSFPGRGSPQDVFSPQFAVPDGQVYSYSILHGILAVVFVIFTGYLMYLAARFFSSVDLQSFLRIALVSFALITILILLPRIPINEVAAIPDGVPEIQTSPSYELPVIPLDTLPQSLIWIVIAGCVLGIIISAVKIIRGRLASKRVEENLLQEAEEAVKAIEAGGELRNVILRCYFQMTETIKDASGIERDYTMTAREFESWLVSNGFPHNPVRQLTSLFEKVRYGEARLGEDDEESADECLNVIINFCRTKREPER